MIGFRSLKLEIEVTKKIVTAPCSRLETKALFRRTKVLRQRKPQVIENACQATTLTTFFMQILPNMKYKH